MTKSQVNSKSTTTKTAVLSSLLLLVTFSVINNLVYKLTQTPDGASYTYNTHSSQLNVELIKVRACHVHVLHAHHHDHDHHHDHFHVV